MKKELTNLKKKFMEDFEKNIMIKNLYSYIGLRRRQEMPDHIVSWTVGESPTLHSR